MPTRPLVTSYRQDVSWFADAWAKAGLAVAVATAIAWPLVASDRWLSVGNQALTSIVGALALMILTGFAGQISLGHAAFLAAGAYTVAVLGVHTHAPFWVALPMGGVVAALLGLAVGPFALRLRGLYLAIVTLGLLFLVDHLLLALPQWTGGPSGTPVPMHAWFTSAPGASSMGDLAGRTGPLSFDQKLYAVFAPLALGATLATAALRQSKTGRAMMAVRDSDLAAEALGVHPARTKVLAFGISSFMAGIAGGMFALQQQYITVEPPFDLGMSVQYIAMIVLGGIGTTFGAVWGALATAFLTPLADSLGGRLPLLAGLPSSQRATLLFSVLVCLVLVFEPLGLYGVWLRIKRYFLAWPFRY